jgi:hypothetical protein
MLTLKSNYFYGNKISDYGIQNGYLDYRTLAKSFNAVLNNDIISKTMDIGFWECISGTEYNEETDSYIDIFQYYIIDSNGAEILQECNEIVYYNEELDLYVWGVTHYGTSWDYVLTDVKIEIE